MTERADRREHLVEQAQGGGLEAEKPAIGGRQEEEAVDRPAECPDRVDLVVGRILDLAGDRPVASFGP
jgi:hypothetical protein